MKAWQKVLIVIISIIVVLCAAGYGVYQLYVIPKIITPVVEKAQEVFQDNNFQTQIEQYADEMIDAGTVKQEQVEHYVEYKNAKSQNTTEAKNNAKAAEEVAKQEAEEPTEGKKSASHSALVEKFRAAMSPDEFAFAYAVYNKIDIGFVSANYYTNRAAVKEYLTKTLSSDELARAIDIYGKYAYILNGN